MKLKSLLLGSAAVLVAATGARAADAIIVEPEPVEYVRICDAYGNGWFYIPGTETCLKFDGDVRVQYGFTDYHDGRGAFVPGTADSVGVVGGVVVVIPGTAASYDDTSAHEWNYRARLNVRANNETEYGTLASRIRFVGSSSEGGHNDVISSNEGPGSAGVVVDWAVISLAGFRLGFQDNYWSTAGGYGYYNARFDGPYGYGNGILFDYTWASNGWTATIGIEDGGASGESGSPDVYGGVTYSGSGWYLAGIVYNDSSEGEIAWKVRADYDFGNGFALGGWYMADDGLTDYVKGHAYGLTAKMNLTDNMVLFGGYGDYNDQSVGGSASRSTWTAGVSWNIVPGLLIQPEWTANVFENENGASRRNHGRFSLRVVRSF